MGKTGNNIKKIEIAIQNKQLDALEDLLYVELNEKEKVAVTKKVKQLWQSLVEAYEKQSSK